MLHWECIMGSGQRILCIFILIFKVTAVKRSGSVVLSDMENCKVKVQLPVYLVNATYIPVGRKVFLNLLFYSEETISGPVKIILENNRCNNLENLDTCEPYRTLKHKNFCPFMKLDKQMWSDIYRNAVPPLMCPLAKGFHKVVNGTLDFKYRLKYFDRYYWRVKKMFWKDDRMLMCLNFKLKVVYYTDH